MRGRLMKSTTELIRNRRFETFPPKTSTLAAREMRVSRREVILREGESAEALYMIVAGQVRPRSRRPRHHGTAHVSRRSHSVGR
ncbi:MAG: hypothetical protein Udaeo2_30310 [Candidatus Udaeobacter sp.]|nr:MAG: hypothetical protein Udaeo2_30310 [Candidatus Udaeobacter sp.]